MLFLISSQRGRGFIIISEVTKNIEKIRLARGFTQEQVAAVLGVSRATYIKVKNGNRDLTIRELEKLSAYFAVPIAELFDQPAVIRRLSKSFISCFIFVKVLSYISSVSSKKISATGP